MDLTFLGTGGSVPTTKRNTVSIALRLGPEVLMFDCGEGTQRQLMASSVSFMKITNIFISHHHGDHFLGLPGLIQSMNFYGREAPLNVYGPIGTQEMVKTILRLGIFDRKYEVQGHDLAPGEVVIGDGYQVAAFKANHTTPALGYAFQENDRPGRFDPDKAKALGVREGPNFSRLVEGYSVQVGSSKVTPDMVMGPSRKGLRLVYSGDTAASSELDQACVDADVLIHEATVASDLEAKAREFGHSTAKDAALLARDSGVGALYLVHISGRYEDVDVLLEEARGIFGPTTIPNDLDMFVLRTDR
ncbi:MAG TPA: ribonuclease Z [Methanomassiliicoccales archaeon]|nr:ribonuclease Z [Methanomassiliicoccales archaeon]HNX47213.1 ribonuclease Z [Methanomassiliicoccales archaeon]HPR97967.1 ribonuclease Z [Methanomassiliicoccales archaeon]